MLKEIRKQPEHIRALFMWLSVFILFSLIVFIWFGFFKAKLVALLNPPEEKVLVSEDSPFATIKQGLGEFKAMIIDIFNKDKDSNQAEREPKLFPLSDDK